MTTSASHLSPLERSRVEDYLNDKIQISADIESLDGLLANLRSQHELQQRQLADAKQILAEATKARGDHVEAIRKRAEAFNEQQADIDRRLMTLTQSETSDQAVKKFESSMATLRRLEISKGYVGLLREIEDSSAEALRNVSAAPALALKPYTRLRELLTRIKDAQPAAEGAAPHLVDHTEKLVSTLREQLKAELNKRLQRTLEQMKWPSKDMNLTDALIQDWSAEVGLLLDLQAAELFPTITSDATKSIEPIVLFPLEVMVHPLELRFKYHFSGDKPTNRLDKPEYFLSHVLDLIGTYSGFFSVYLQPIFDSRAPVLGSTREQTFRNAPHAFIAAVLPMLRRKINSFLPQISAQPQLLSHFVHELMKFDNEVRGSWNYLPDLSKHQWEGLTSLVLTEQGWFDRWLQVEKDFALARYKEIIETPDSGEIDFDGWGLLATKPTKAAIRVNDLLETITERYKPLSSFSQKLRFLIDIQITIFDQFHERLHSALEAYLAMTSTIGRTVQGADGQASVEGVAGLERLCRVFGSAEFMEKKMQDWSNDVFFVELWSELQERVRQNRDGGRNVAGPMSLADVASRTSRAVSNPDVVGTADSTDGALFDETASALRRLRVRSESIITSTVTSNALAALKPFTRVSTWATLSTSSSSTSSSLAPSSSLGPALRVLSTEISFLSQALGVAPLRRITRQLVLSVQNYIWSSVLTRHTFSYAGALQLASDVDHLCSVIDVSLGPVGRAGDSERIMQKLYEGLTLLCLRLSGQRGHGSHVEQEQEHLAPSGEEGIGLGLWDVEKRLFRDNESARNVLTDLQIETLSETEARSVVERRVEINS